MALAVENRPVRGRPQDDELTRQILEETRRQLESHGYPELRIERIAAAIGCGKSAIYRRWANRGELVAASMDRASALGVVPDTGSVVDDLLAHAAQNVANQSDTAGDGGFAALVAPEVRTPLWNDGFLAHRRRMGREILARAVERGQLPDDLDADAVLDALAGFVLYRRTIRPTVIDEGVLRAIVEAIVARPPRAASGGTDSEETP